MLSEIERTYTDEHASPKSTIQPNKAGRKSSRGQGRTTRVAEHLGGFGRPPRIGRHQEAQWRKAWHPLETGRQGVGNLTWGIHVNPWFTKICRRSTGRRCWNSRGLPRSRGYLAAG